MYIKYTYKQEKLAELSLSRCITGDVCFLFYQFPMSSTIYHFKDNFYRKRELLLNYWWRHVCLDGVFWKTWHAVHYSWTLMAGHLCWWAWYCIPKAMQGHFQLVSAPLSSVESLQIALLWKEKRVKVLWSYRLMSSSSRFIHNPITWKVNVPYLVSDIV